LHILKSPCFFCKKGEPVIPQGWPGYLEVQIRQFFLHKFYPRMDFHADQVAAEMVLKDGATPPEKLFT
jgi:hypothetical protein